jgi:signal transduction histidine kinase
MHPIEQTSLAAGLNPTGAACKHVETAVEVLSNLHSEGESLAAVAHDARNMVAALGLYCDLLDEPGVLAAPFAHYGSELRLVASASLRLVEKLMTLEHPDDAAPSFWRDAPAGGLWPLRRPSESPRHRSIALDPLPSAPVANLADELMAIHNLLAALAGPAVAVTLYVDGGALPVRITSEDLTRVLVNLVKNAVEAMPSGGRIQIALREQSVEAASSLVLTVEDNGPGIPADAFEKVFASGYTTHPANSHSETAHRGLGLAITRSIVEAAGGRIRAENRAPCGVCIVIEMPQGASHPGREQEASEGVKE